MLQNPTLIATQQPPPPKKKKNDDRYMHHISNRKLPFYISFFSPNNIFRNYEIMVMYCHYLYFKQLKSSIHFPSERRQFFREFSRLSADREVCTERHGTRSHHLWADLSCHSAGVWRVSWPAQNGNAAGRLFVSASVASELGRRYVSAGVLLSVGGGVDHDVTAGCWERERRP